MNRMQSPSNSLDKNIKKELKILLNPISNLKQASTKRFPKIQISEIYSSLYKEIFPLILTISKSKFFEKINNEADEIISKGGLKTSKNFTEIIDSKENILKKYISDYNFLAIEYRNFSKNKKNYNYLTHFRKHCGLTKKYGCHYCANNQSSKFIEIKRNGEISYAICENCKICYSVDFILMFCTVCNRKYFSNILSKNENENLLPATWAKYHCNSLINEIMKCIACKNILYLNLKTGYLICTNKKCKFTSKPENILWTCNSCGYEFTSPAKIYNPLEFKILRKSIKFALIKRIKAAPKKLPCGCRKDLSNLIFYHKEECKGELYKGTLMDKNIIVCSECHAINFEDKFSWICPICGAKFHLHSVIGTKPFAKKKYIINKSFNRSLKMNERKFNLAKNLKLDNNSIEKTINMNFSRRISSNIPKRIYFKDFKNNLSQKDNYDSINEVQLFDCTDKNRIISLNESKNNYSNSSKSKKYRTLLDILKNRQLSESGKNKKKEENEINKTIIPKTTKNKANILINLSIPNRNDTKINHNHNKFRLSKYIKLDINKKEENSEINRITVNKIISPINQRKKEIKFEDNRELNKGVLDTTDNSTFKTLSTNEANMAYKSIHNEKCNNIKSYRFLKQKKLVNNNQEKNKDMFRLYKDNSHKLSLIKYENEPYYSEQINQFRDTTNIHLNQNKNSIIISSYFTKSLPYSSDNNKNLENSEANDLRETVQSYLISNNNILYSDKTENYNSPSEQNKKIKEKEEKNKIVSPFRSDKLALHHKKKSSLDEEEKKMLIKDFIINSNNKKHFRESLILHQNNMRQSILISQEKLNNLAKKTNVPSFNESDYSYLKSIGEGTYGSVYLVEHNETMEHFALKKIICRDYYELIKQKEELELIFSVKHENILKLYGIQFKFLDETTSSIYVLMELAKSDWNKEIKKRILAKKYYKENEIISLLKQIIKGFLFLQEKSIAHRDIKPQNILLFPNNVYKIADFGEAKFIKNINEQSTLRGSELFMSPLLYKGYKFNQKNVYHNPFKSDVFSLGYCLLYAMFLNLNILDSLRELNTMKSIINCLNKNINKNIFSEQMMNLIYKMIEPNEDLRYNFEDLSNELSKFKI